MNWVETSIETLSREDGMCVEIISAMLMERGITGIQVEDDYEMRMFLENNEDFWDYADEELMNKEKGAAYIRFYIEEKFASEVLNEIKSALEGLKWGELGNVLGSLEMKSSVVDEEEWINNWKKYYKPLKIGKRVVVKPVWEEYEKADGEVVVSLNPGQVFGTGLHQTTQMCIEMLEKNVSDKMTFLDAGCGSGILAISALLLSEGGCAVAFDIDRAAEEIVLANIGYNDITVNRFAVYTGNILRDKAVFDKVALKKYDLIFVNIVADVIIEMISRLRGLLTDNGFFILSGIIKGRVADVAACLENNKLRVTDSIVKDEWVCLKGEV